MGGGGVWEGLALLLGHGEFLHAQLCGLVEVGSMSYRIMKQLSCFPCKNW